MPQRTYIADFAPNQLIEGVFAIQNAQLGLTKNGKPYLKCLLVDRSGRAPGRMWSATEELINSLPTNGFVFVEGQTQPYQGEMQVIIRDIQATTPSDDDLPDLLPSTERNIEEMFTIVRNKLNSLSSPALRALAEQYLGDDELMKMFRRAPAAVQLHHAYIGGLLEHTLSLMQLADKVTPLYPQINAQIVTFGLFLHDLGKCTELTWETGFSYSDEGQLIGHIAKGILWLQAKAEAARAAGHTIPQPLLQVLHHIILSHHGVPEFGALKTPSTPEAILIHLLDNIDAKMNMSLAAVNSGNPNADLGGNFTEKVWALGTRLYRPDTLADEEAFAGPSGDGTSGDTAPEPAAGGGEVKSDGSDGKGDDSLFDGGGGGAESGGAGGADGSSSSAKPGGSPKPGKTAKAAPSHDLKGGLG